MIHNNLCQLLLFSRIDYIFHMHGILYYSSISGNTALVAEAIRDSLWKAGIELTLQNVAENTLWHPLKSTECQVPSAQTEAEKIGTLNSKLGTSPDFILLGCGTYGHGQLQNMLRQCLEKTWKDVYLAGISCAAFGLGDHRYDREYNIYAANLLEDWLREHGGNILCPALRINRSPIKPSNQKIIETWAENFITSIRA